MVQMALVKVKNENEFKLDWRKEGDAVRQLRSIAVLSLPTLQRLYQIYYKEDAARCDDSALLIRKLQYWFQLKYYKYQEKFNGKDPIPTDVEKKCYRIMALPLTQREVPMGKATALKAKAKEVEETEEEEEAEEVEEEAEEQEEEEEEEEETETAEEKTKRTGVKRDGTVHVVKLGGLKFKGKFLYEVLPALLKANRKIKASDHVIAEAIRKAWAGTGMNYEDRRVAGERTMYNKGKIKGMTGVPEHPLKEYDEKGNVKVRVIPEQLKKFVKKGQPVKQTIAENKKKGLIKKSKAKAEPEESEEEE